MTSGRARNVTVMAFIGVAVVALTTACSATPTPETAVPTALASAASPTTPLPDPPTTAPPAAEPDAAQVLITISNFEFKVPQAVSPGATVTVVNEDSMAHTVTSTDPGAFDVTVAGGATITFVAPAKAGSYDFVCSFHGNMKGTLVVS